MKFTLQINQVALDKAGLRGCVDFIDASLIFYLVDFFSSDNPSVKDAKKSFEGVDYWWLSHGMISDELPYLNMEKEAIRKRLRKLCGLGLITMMDPKTCQALAKTYYAPTEKLRVIYLESRQKPNHTYEPKDTPYEQPFTGVYTTVHTPYEQPFIPPMNNGSYNPTTIDQTIINQTTNIPISQAESDFFEVEDVDFSKPKLPNCKPFEMGMEERERLLSGMKVNTTDSEIVAWLFGMDKVGPFEEGLFMKMSESDKKLFSERVAKFVLLSSEARFRGTLAGYLSKKKYLQEPVDYRPKPATPKLTPAEEKQMHSINLAREMMQRVENSRIAKEQSNEN